MAGRRGLAALPDSRRGALIFVVASLVFVATDSLTKSLVSDLPVVDVIFGRHVAYLAILVVAFGRMRPRRLLVTQRPLTHVARGLTMFGATASFFLSLSLLPLAETSTLASTTPLWIVALAGPVLGERVARAAILGTIIGFAGVVTMIGLDLARLDAAVLIPLGTALSYAFFSILTRKLRAEDPEVTMFYSGLVGLVAAAVLFVIVPVAHGPEPSQWAAISLVGLSALLGHRLLVAAYRWGRASDLAPLGYLSLVFSFISGAILFGEPVEARAVIGAVAIAGGGLITVRAASDEDEPPPTSVDYADPVDVEPSVRAAPAAGR